MRHPSHLIPALTLGWALTAQTVCDHLEVPLIFGLGDFNDRTLSIPGQTGSRRESYGWGYGLAAYRSYGLGTRLALFQGVHWTQAQNDVANPVPDGPRLEYGHFQISCVAGAQVFPGGRAGLREGVYLLGALSPGLEIYTLRDGEWGDTRRRTTRFRPGAQVGIGYSGHTRRDIGWSVGIIYHPSFTHAGHTVTDLPRSNFIALSIGFF